MPKRLPKSKSTLDKQTLLKVVKSIWFFPSLLTICLVVLAALQISGSSIGLYHIMFYGDKPDSNLLANKPESIRSDEWLVNSQKAIAQKNNNFKTVNDNLGEGEDASLLADAPTRDWTGVFKPQNFGFFVLPFDTAFALRWWMVSYFLVISCYFFVLLLLPKKTLLASLLSLAFLFSPFFQWWYTSGSLGSVYYTLFGIVIFVKLLHSKRKLEAALWGALLAYIAVCFALILYPPFQVPCLMVAAAFLLGYILNQRKEFDPSIFKRNLAYLGGSVLISVAIVGLVIYQKHNVIMAIQNTAYPGQRVVESGGYNKEHFFSSNLGALFQDRKKADNYARPSINAINQSESSNFMLIFPYLLVPLLYLGYKKYREKKQIDYVLLAIVAMTALFLAWLFIPGLDILGSLTFLNRVPLPRLLMGIGLLNLIFIIWFIKLYQEQKKQPSVHISIIYSLLVTIFVLLIGFRVMSKYPGFVDFNSVVILTVPISIIMFSLCQGYYRFGILIFALFSLFSVNQINPLYRGTDILSKTQLSRTMKETGGDTRKKWVSEEIVLENFATMNGLPSLTGTYLYPQLDVWRQLHQKDKESLYNRYAHISFTFDRSPDQVIKPTLFAPGPDQLNIKIEPCDNFFKQNNTGFLITTRKFDTQNAPCASFAEEVIYPARTYYIYRLQF